MFPFVDRYSLSALARFCTGKSAPRTTIFIDKVWDKEALNRMMLMTGTPDLDALVLWLVSPNIKEKLSIITNNFNQFK